MLGEVPQMDAHMTDEVISIGGDEGVNGTGEEGETLAIGTGGVEHRGTRPCPLLTLTCTHNTYTRG